MLCHVDNRWRAVKCHCKCGAVFVQGWRHWQESVIDAEDWQFSDTVDTRPA